MMIDNELLQQIKSREKTIDMVVNILLEYKEKWILTNTCPILEELEEISHEMMSINM